MTDLLPVAAFLAYGIGVLAIMFWGTTGGGR